MRASVWATIVDNGVQPGSRLQSLLVAKDLKYAYRFDISVLFTGQGHLRRITLDSVM